MKPIDEVRALLKNAGLRTSAARDEKVLADALHAGGLNRDNRLARREPSIWRTIMKSRTTKLASAAVIVAAIIISLSHFNEPVVKAVEFSEISKAMEQVPWMHMTGSAQERGITGVGEQWIGFDAKVVADTVPNSKVTFCCYKEHEKAEYDPNSRTITLNYVREEEFSPQMSSAIQMMESMYQVLKDKGAEIVTKTGDYRGRKVQVQEISVSLPEQGLQQCSIVLYIDPQTKLLQGYEEKAVKPDGAVFSSTCGCDYPKAGPRDIYDLGVPRNARVVDNKPAPDFSKVLEEYNRRRTDGIMKEYEAIIVNADENGVVKWLDVDYKSGSKTRYESHSVFRQDESPTRLWPQYRERLGNTFESMLAWTRQRYDDPRQGGRFKIELDDGKNCYQIARSESGTWGKPAQFPTHNGFSFFPSLGRPAIRPTAHIIEDDYSRRNKLICIEEVSQGRVAGSGGQGSVSLPSRNLCYLDPAHDYLCYRHVAEERKDAAWQENKNWLDGVDPNRVPAGSINIREITATFQAENGHYYPRTIVSKWTGLFSWTTTEETTICTVYLKIPPTFPEGIFDPNKLPGQ